MSLRRLLPILVALGLVLAACSSEDGTDAASDTTEAAAEATDDGSSGEDAGPGQPLARYADYETTSYDDPTRWVCRPDLDDLCDGDLSATVVEADGTLTVEPFEAAADPPIDCFYVYPTISRDQSAFSDWNASDDEEGYVTVNQAARLQSECRLFAPVYRQITLSSLTARLVGEEVESDEDIDPFADVLDAFRTYLANDNEGRGIVLIGHSQGSSMLTQLIATEIDPNDDVRALLVGAYLAGSSVAVPEGELVGGSFAQVPLCSSNGEVGCVTTWATFRADAPPPDGAFFGRPRAEEGVAGCVSPADVTGGTADLDAYFPTRGGSILSGDDAPSDASTWLDPAVGEIDTPFVRVPGLVGGECTTADGFAFLAATVAGDPSDPRADDIPGDLTPEWGLHLVDVNLVMGDIVRQVRAQAEAYGR